MDKNKIAEPTPITNWVVAMVACGIAGALLSVGLGVVGVLIVLLAWLSLQLERLIGTQKQIVAKQSSTAKIKA